MTNIKNFKKHNRKISQKLLESIYLAEALEELLECYAKEAAILKVINNNIKIAFKENEKIWKRRFGTE